MKFFNHWCSSFVLPNTDYCEGLGKGVWKRSAFFDDNTHVDVRSKSYATAKLLWKVWREHNSYHIIS